MKEFIEIGVDLANYFQVHTLESEDGRATTRKLSRRAMRKFFWRRSLASSAWRAGARRIIGQRELQAMGHEVRLIRPITGCEAREE